MVEMVRGHVSDHGGEGKKAIRRDIAKPFYAPKKDRETYPLIIGIHGNIPYFFCKWSFQRDNHI